jgi:FixJ family two-component response regulator
MRTTQDAAREAAIPQVRREGELMNLVELHTPAQGVRRIVDTPSVFVIDDDPAVRESLGHVIRDAGWRAELFASAEEFLRRDREPRPACLILDVNLPRLGGLELQRRLAANGDALQIVFITAVGDVHTTVRAMKAGAVEFLTKPLNPDALLDAVDEALTRSAAIVEREAATRELRERYATLTPRERQVLELVVSGRLNKQVGFMLGITEITVKAHRGKLMRKMEAKSIADLVRKASLLQRR